MIDYLSKMINIAGMKPVDIAVISPYSAQVSLLNKRWTWLKIAVTVV